MFFHAGIEAVPGPAISADALLLFPPGAPASSPANCREEVDMVLTLQTNWRWNSSLLCSSALPGFYESAAGETPAFPGLDSQNPLI